MSIQNYNRPVAHPTIVTPIVMSFAASLQVRSPAMFGFHVDNGLVSLNHHDILVIGDETFQFIDPVVSNLVTNDSYIAVKLDHAFLDTSHAMAFLYFALSRIDAAHAPDLIGFVPKKLDGTTPAKIMTDHRYVCGLYPIVYPNTYLMVMFNGVGTATELWPDIIMKSGHDQIPNSTNNHGLLFVPTPAIGMAGAHSDWPAIERDQKTSGELSGLGSTLTINIQGDADERDPQQLLGTLFRADLTPALDAGGNLQLDVDVTPVLGTGADSVAPWPTDIAVPHPENVDTWQTERGRPRQDYTGLDIVEEDDGLLFNGNVLGS